ncbi:methionyl-tRNA formyltransferase [Lewinella cohaerens]|uniref:methionyl-tRNA formyltransferase n=1 Tax=Lewinella cohaerens TaxID=70995 RepID=UPI00035F6B98|nr:methionyl-tRNA formyltransferase [Lewinella cohaerens]
MQPRIIFMGTPDFAVSSLDALIEAGHNVVAVITATDKMGGRGGKKLLESAVKKYAVAKEIPVLQPKNLKSPDFLAALANYQADLQVVVAFRMLPKAVWAMPRLGTFNLHGSLLPKYRGAAPINWAVINGETETGVTTFFIQEEIDTGDLIFQEKMTIGENESVGDVHDRMMVLGAQTVVKTVDAIAKGEIDAQQQDHQQASPAPKLTAENTRIDFNQPVKKVHDFIRGLNPYPTAWTTLEDKKWKILKTIPHQEAHQLEAGTIITDGKTDFKIATSDGFLEVLELQVPGKRRMNTRDFLNGWRADQAFGKFI